MMVIAALFLALVLCVCLQTLLKRRLKGLQTSCQMHAFLEFQAPFAKPGEAPAKPTRSLRGPISCYHPLASASEAQTSPSFPPAAENQFANLCTNPCLAQPLAKPPHQCIGLWQPRKNAAQFVLTKCINPWVEIKL